jgi:two-component system, chemotaxis family, CheB/CheR fusion protein
MNAPVTDDPKPNRTAAVTRIVGLGASAGGLEALQQFLTNVPPASGLAYVIVQHLDPTHKAMLTDLLQRTTTMPVHEATDSMPVKPGNVYVIPPNADLTVVGGRLHVAVPLQPRGLRLPIDMLFCSLAREHGERAIGVVLSGMGTDGTLGLQAIKSQGGLTLAQEPASAQFDSMPKSAIAASACDIVATAAELPDRIVLVTSKRVAATPTIVSSDEDSTQPLNAILNLLREHSKHDLTLYKTSTLKRRIERRMSVHALDTLAGYEHFVKENPQELDLLFKEMLIGVTHFFRDPAVWQELEDSVLPALMPTRSQSRSARSPTRNPHPEPGHCRSLRPTSTLMQLPLHATDNSPQRSPTI